MTLEKYRYLYIKVHNTSKLVDIALEQNFQTYFSPDGLPFYI